MTKKELYTFDVIFATQIMRIKQIQRNVKRRYKYSYERFQISST